MSLNQPSQTPHAFTTTKTTTKTTTTMLHKHGLKVQSRQSGLCQSMWITNAHFRFKS
eukprot:m.24435 g.24435  ORF g.24435 m.24435 type:complete len:57 (-) comp8592_c0_seq1:37-207(-)